MLKYSLNDIRKIIEDLAKKIGANNDLLPNYGHSKDGMRSYIKIDESGLLYYIDVERGQEVGRSVYLDIQDFLYHVFFNVTHIMALQFELNNRHENIDFRRIMFDKQEQLLGVLNKSWATKTKQKHEEILKSSPYDDFAGPRVNYFKMLKDLELSDEDAWKRACEKYPLPK